MKALKEPPVVSLYNVARFSGDFGLVEVRMQGDKVLSREVLELSPILSEIREAFRVATDKKFFKREKVN